LDPPPCNPIQSFCPFSDANGVQFMNQALPPRFPPPPLLPMFSLYDSLPQLVFPPKIISSVFVSLLGVGPHRFSSVKVDLEREWPLKAVNRGLFPFLSPSCSRISSRLFSDKLGCHRENGLPGLLSQGPLSWRELFPQKPPLDIRLGYFHKTNRSLISVPFPLLPTLPLMSVQGRGISLTPRSRLH